MKLPLLRLEADLENHYGGLYQARCRAIASPWWWVGTLSIQPPLNRRGSLDPT